jgi:hypothetical protein
MSNVWIVKKLRTTHAFFRKGSFGYILSKKGYDFFYI